MFKVSKKCSFQVFEYSDPDKHILKRVTQLEIEPISEIPILLNNGSYEGVIGLVTPPEQDIFTIKCSHNDDLDLKVEVGPIVPNENYSIDASISRWNVPIKLTYTKTEGVDPDQAPIRFLFLSFIDVTSGNKENHHAFAKHLLRVSLSGQ